MRSCFIFLMFSSNSMLTHNHAMLSAVQVLVYSEVSRCLSLSFTCKVGVYPCLAPEGILANIGLGWKWPTAEQYDTEIIISLRNFKVRTPVVAVTGQRQFLYWRPQISGRKALPHHPRGQKDRPVCPLHPGPVRTLHDRVHQDGLPLPLVQHPTDSPFAGKI